MIKTGLFWSNIAVVLMLFASFYGWAVLPADSKIPIHWNIHGEVDDYTSKFNGLILLPLINLCLNFLAALLLIAIPRRENIQQSKKAYLAGWIGGATVIAFVHILIVYSAISGTSPSIDTFYVSIALLLIILGNYIPKSRSNWLVGVRTPWSLSSENAWTASNRVGGFGFIATGISTTLAAFLGRFPLTQNILLIGVVSTAVISITVSYFVWKREQDTEQY